MKKLFKFAPLCALLLAVVAFILLLAGEALVHDYELMGKVHDFYSGSVVLFGKGNAVILSISTAVEDGVGAWNAILSFIFMIVALLALLVSSIMVFVKIKFLEKFGGIIALVAGGLLLVAGIFLFFSKAAFGAANDMGDGLKDYSLGAAWIISAILAIVAGVVSAFPAVAALVEKN